MISLRRHAMEELYRAGWSNVATDYGQHVGDSVLSLIVAYEKVGASGGSAPIILAMFTRLANRGILTPLTGGIEEWGGHLDGGFVQNQRLSSVFRDIITEEAWDVDAVVYEDPSGVRFTKPIAREDREPISFPYTPKQRVVMVDVNHEIVDVAKAVGLPIPNTIAQAVIERDGWMEEAARYARNADYYRGLLVAIGELLGPEARTADNGVSSADVLVAKLPELVAKLIERAR